MRMILATDVKLEGVVEAEARALFEKVKPILISKYSGTKDGSDISWPIIEAKLGVVYAATGGKLQDTTFLDLGCGSKSQDGIDGKYADTSSYGNRKSSFEPWLCRTLHEIGVKTIGIDTGYLREEEFEHHIRNLLADDALKDIPDHSVDYVHSSLLYSSPVLRDMISRSRWDKKMKPYEGEMECWTGCADEQEAERVLRPILMPQIERVLKPSGVYIVIE